MMQPQDWIEISHRWIRIPQWWIKIPQRWTEICEGCEITQYKPMQHQFMASFASTCVFHIELRVLNLYLSVTGYLNIKY